MTTTDPAAILRAASEKLRAGEVAMLADVALALADWLAKEATIWVGVAEPGKKVVWENGEWEVTVPLSSQPEALAVAEAILGPGWAFRRAEQHLRTADQPQEES